MGLVDWIIKRKLKKRLNSKSEDEMALLADELLKQTSGQYNNTLRNASKINQANLMRLKERQLREQLKLGLDDVDDDEEDEEEDEEPEGIAETLINNIIKGTLTKSSPMTSVATGVAASTSDLELLSQLKKRFPNLAKYDDATCLRLAEAYASKI